jgi:hypothetical protein
MSESQKCQKNSNKKTRNESESEEQEHIDDSDNMMQVTRGQEWGRGMGGR